MRWGVPACSRVSPANPIVALALLITTTAVAHGQAKSDTREGFWIGFGLGYGSLGCDGCNDRESGRAGFLKMGGTLNRQWLLGGEIEFWATGSDQHETTLTTRAVWHRQSRSTAAARSGLQVGKMIGAPSRP